MKPCRAIWILMAIVLIPVCAASQELPTDESAPLVLVRIIPIPGVLGRFDHMAVDNSGGRVFAAIYGTIASRLWTQLVEFDRAASKKDSSSLRWWRILRI